jgi:hypothetical protein
MKTRLWRVRVVVVFALMVTLAGLSSDVQAHPKLAEAGWKEINGPWRLTFKEGQKTDNTWSGSWSGNLHNDNKDHPNGLYVLTMENTTTGKLTLYENNKELCSGIVHFKDIHQLKFGTAEYRRER